MKKRIKKGVYLVKKKFKEGQVPLGVTIIALLHYIIALSTSIFGIVTLIAGFFSSSGFLIINSIFYIGTGIFLYFVGKNLWDGKNWARIFVIIIMGLGVIFSLFSIVQGRLVYFFNLAINLVVVGYLIFDKMVKESFANSTKSIIN